jgi:hypothetical protein
MYGKYGNKGCNGDCGLCCVHKCGAKCYKHANILKKFTMLHPVTQFYLVQGASFGLMAFIVDLKKPAKSMPETVPPLLRFNVCVAYCVGRLLRACLAGGFGGLLWPLIGLHISIEEYAIPQATPTV